MEQRTVMMKKLRQKKKRKHGEITVVSCVFELQSVAAYVGITIEI